MAIIQDENYLGECALRSNSSAAINDRRAVRVEREYDLLLAIESVFLIDVKQ